MKTIVCPFDNGTVAANAIAYAKHLSKNTQSRLVLFKKQFMYNLFRNLHFLFSASKSDFIRFSSPHWNREISSRKALDDNTEPVMQMQSISAIAAIARSEKADLILTATEASFSFNDLHVETIGNLLRQAQCPLLLIPEGVCYKPIKKIVVVIDHEVNITHRIDFLLQVALLYQAHISFLQIYKEENQQAGNHFLESWREMYLAFPYANTAFFENKEGCIPKAIREFVSKLQADLLVIIPDSQTTDPYVYATSYQYNEYTQESISIPVLALDTLPKPSVDFYNNYYESVKKAGL